MKEEEIKKQLAEILRKDIHYSLQLVNYVIHGAIEAIWKLMQEYAAQLQSAPKLEININAEDILKKHLEIAKNPSQWPDKYKEAELFYNPYIEAMEEYAAQPKAIHPLNKKT